MPEQRKRKSKSTPAARKRQPKSQVSKIFPGLRRLG